MSVAEQPVRPTDEEILSFERQIKAQEENKPLVSPQLSFEALQLEYQNGLPIYISKIHSIVKTCLSMRSVRKDGNCFYRAFAFRFCELLLQNRGMQWQKVAIERAKESKALLTTMGYDMGLLEDFWEGFDNALTLHSSPEDEFKSDAESAAALLEMFQTQHLCDTIVCYLRLVTAALLKRDRDLYEAFILDDYPSLDAFISSCVDPMNVESDQIHIVAMANAFGIDIRVANLDTTPSDSINYHDISPMEPMQVDQVPCITLLYRPGHYDILYPKPNST